MKVITAIGDEYLNNKLKEQYNIEIICNDIIYKEGILEIIEKYEDIDLLIFSELLAGEIELKELIEKIKEKNNKIKIIIILEEKNEKLENYLYSKGINKIIYDNKINFDELLNLINSEGENEEDLKEEINKLKNIILENQNNKNKLNNKKLIKNNKIKNKEKIINNNYNNILNNSEINNNFNKNNNSKKYIKKYIILNKLKNIKIFRKINKNKKIFNNNSNSKKIISIVGPRGAGKSIISVNLAKINIYTKNKILILDFDFFNNSIYTIFGTKKHLINNLKMNNNYFPDEKNIKNYNEIDEEKNNKIIINYILNNIIKINKKIDLISGDILLNNKKNNFNKINNNKNINFNLINSENINEKINLLINKLNKIYDLIIIDNSSENNIEILKNIINLSDKTIFISDTNLLEINKSIKLLQKYILGNKINKNKFNILFNKYNSNSINLNLLKKIFNELNILGYLKYSEKYNKLINKNNRFNFLNKKLRKEYLKINKKLWEV